ncbi:unnamed protein product [Urochloa humidicola]
MLDALPTAPARRSYGRRSARTPPPRRGGRRFSLPAATETHHENDRFGPELARSGDEGHGSEQGTRGSGLRTSEKGVVAGEDGGCRLHDELTPSAESAPPPPSLQGPGFRPPCSGDGEEEERQGRTPGGGGG